MVNAEHYQSGSKTEQQEILFHVWVYYLQVEQNATVILTHMKGEKQANELSYSYLTHKTWQNKTKNLFL